MCNCTDLDFKQKKKERKGKDPLPRSSSENLRKGFGVPRLGHIPASGPFTGVRTWSILIGHFGSGVCTWLQRWRPSAPLDPITQTCPQRRGENTITGEPLWPQLPSPSQVSGQWTTSAISNYRLIFTFMCLMPVSVARLKAGCSVRTNQLVQHKRFSGKCLISSQQHLQIPDGC